MAASSQRIASALRAGNASEEQKAGRPWPRLGIEHIWSNAPLLLSVSSLLWSGNFVVARAVQGAITPLDLSFWRWLAALAVIAGLARRHLRQDFKQLRRHWVTLLALAAAGIAAMNTLYYCGLQSTTALNALLLQSAAPLLVLSCTLALYGERPRPRQIIAVLVSLLGVAAIAAHGDPLLAWRGFGFRSGDLWIVAGTLCYALYAALLRRRPTVHASSFLTACFTLGVLLLLPFVILEHLTYEVARPSGRVMLAVAYLALFPSVLAFLCLNRGVDLIGAGCAGHYVHLMPVFGSVLAMSFLGEQPHLYHGASAALIASGLLLASRASRPSPAARPGPSWLVRSWRHWRFCSRHARQRWELRHADAQTIRDLGPSRVSHEIEKPIWRG